MLTNGIWEPMLKDSLYIIILELKTKVQTFTNWVNLIVS